MKVIKGIGILLFSLLIGGCAYLMPTYVSETEQKLYEDTMGHRVPAYKGVTATAVLAAAEKELDFQRMIYLTKWEFVKQTTGAKIQLSNQVSDMAMPILAGMFPVAAAFAHSVGAKKKRKGDLSPEEAEVLKHKYGVKDPEEFKKEVGI